MRFLATVMLMVSLVAITITAASADITRPPCSSRIRAGDMCYAASLPGNTAETIKKPGICFLCLAPVDDAHDAAQPGSRVRAAFVAVVLADARWVVPWRLPRG